MENDRKELNLTDVFSGLWKGIVACLHWAWNAFVWCLRLFYRHKTITLIFLLAGLAGGALEYFLNTPYKSGFILTCPTTRVYYGIEEARNLNRHCQKKTLADWLVLDDSIASQVQAVDAYHVVDRWQDDVIDLIDFKGKYGEDTLVNTWSNRCFYVEVLTESEKAVPAVKDAIVKKLCQRPMLKTPWTTEMAAAKQNIDTYRHELARLDSVQSLLYSAENIKPDVSGRITTGDAFDRLEYVAERRVQIFTYERQFLLDRMVSSQRYLDELSRGAVFSELPVQYDGKATSLPKALFIYGVLGLIVAFVMEVFCEKKSDLAAFLRG